MPSSASAGLGGLGRAGLARGHLGGRLRRPRPPGRVRPRRLSAARGHRPLLAGDGGGGRFAADGGPVVGICNGFQVLTEAGLLPGALQKNRGLRFLCTTVDGPGGDARTRCSPPGSPWAPSCASRSTTSRATTPATPTTLAELRDEDRIVLRYSGNPNGSVDDIAGVCNAARNVVGLMPHPERAVRPAAGLGRRDGPARGPAGVGRDRGGVPGRGLGGLSGHLGCGPPMRLLSCRRLRALSYGCGGSWPAGAPRR